MTGEVAVEDGADETSDVEVLEVVVIGVLVGTRVVLVLVGTAVVETAVLVGEGRGSPSHHP